MAEAENIEGLRQENFTWLLWVDELQEKTARLERELEVAKSQREQAETRVATLEQWVQAGKKEGGSKEVRCLIAAEAERIRALEQLIVNEAQKSREQEEKLQRMQKEMAAWTSSFPEACATQAGEQKEMLQKLEVSRSLIGVLQKEVHSQEDQIEGLQEELEDWQQKCIRAEHLAQELQDKLLESHTQAKEAEKVILKEMEKVRTYMANYEALQDQKLSLEKEIEALNKESDGLQAQLQRVETEKDQLGEQVQLLKALIEDSSTKEAVMRTEGEQLQLQVQAAKQQAQALEAENKRL
ncbi:PREDICTED: tropomyosin alpha-3 chain-like [Gavialis gangeticus]|uniref:tropomyosin alpha-3 chain-like n=1 Tax=Gavialis gangeticus TaxID=94835 RepID=UPI00092F8866|nr:PREDICTED: tropomyosin alpha-3 chain-like [Gavialis gangeticus]